MKQKVKSKIYKLTPGDIILNEEGFTEQIKEIKKTKDENWVRIYMKQEDPNIQVSILVEKNADIMVVI